jgi:hypothetical protein
VRLSALTVRGQIDRMKFALRGEVNCLGRQSIVRA